MQVSSEIQPQNKNRGAVPCLTVAVVCVLSVISASLFEFFAGAVGSILPTLVSLVAVAASVVFVSSDKHGAVAFAIIIPALVLQYFFVGPVFFGVTVLIVLSSVAAGLAIRNGRGYISAVMLFSFAVFVLVLSAVCFFVIRDGIDIKTFISDFSRDLKSSLAVSVKEAYGELGFSDDEISLVVQTVKSIVDMSVAFLPSFVFVLAEIFAIVAVRAASIFFNIFGSAAYTGTLRQARLSAPAAICFIVSLLVALIFGGVLSVSAGNVVMSLIFPAAFAGASGYLRRASRMRGGSPGAFQIVLVAVAFVSSTAFALIVFAVAASVVALKPKKFKDIF